MSRLSVGLSRYNRVLFASRTAPLLAAAGVFVLVLGSGPVEALDLTETREKLLSVGSALVDCFSTLNPISAAGCLISRGMDQVVLNNRFERFKRETSLEIDREVAQQVQDAMRPGRREAAELRRLGQQLTRQLLDYAIELRELEPRIASLEKEIAFLRARQDAAEGRSRTKPDAEAQSPPKPRYLYVFGAAVGETLISTENGRPESSDGRIRGGWAAGVGGQGSQAFLVNYEKRGPVAYKNPESGVEFGSLERERAQVVIDISTSEGDGPGLGVRVGGEYRTGRFRLMASSEPPRESRSYLGGIGLSFGGLNEPRTLGGGVTADWRWGKSHIDLLHDGLRSTEAAKIRLQRYELWGVAGRTFFLLEARVFLEVVDQELPSDAGELNGLPPWLGSDPPPLWTARETSAGAFVGVRLLFK